MSISRRETLCLIGGGLAALVLPGCGGKGGNSGGVAPPLKTTGSVNLAQIGGTGLKALTLDGTNPAVTSTGSLTVPVSQSQAQVHLLVDSGGGLRSMSVTAGSLTSKFGHDATSTAVSLVFMTLGILTTDPSEADTRLSRIESLPSFPAWESYVATKLKSNPVSGLGSDSSALQLLSKCVTDYQAAYPQSLALASIGRSSVGSGVAIGYAGAEISLQNNGFRYVEVVREDISAHADDLGADNAGLTLKPCILAGLNGVSIGSIFTDSVGEANGRAFDTGNFDNDAHTLAQVRYWVRGFGIGAGSESPPADINNAFTGLDSFGTILHYLLLPILDIVSSVLDTFPAGPKIVAELVKLVQDAASLGSDLFDAFFNGDESEISAAIDKIYSTLAGEMETLLPQIIKAAGIVLADAELAALAGMVSAALLGISTGLAALNLIFLIQTILKFPATAQTTLRIAGADGGVN